MKILIIDDQQVVCQGLAAILGSEEDMEIAALGANGREALELADETGPDLILMDLNMPVMNGVLATKEIKSRHPSIPVLILTTYATDQWLFDALRAGADGYLLKDISSELLIEAVRRTVKGDSFLDPQVTGRVMKAFACAGFPMEKSIPDDFTDREMDVLELLVRGLSNSQIAERANLAPGTVRNYISRILQKLGAEDRIQAALLAVKRGLVSSERPF
ncbi:response regulator transcription factor [Spirochaeta isovalerica]|uniref:DNA-binding NarL/FixJ family response regulator n=1 Tax=Spirochaeta isovalerica TaxID=150 RepID=A0A841R9Z5_9SPIO|nr:response regulator transcription factor [Spirochaeta isovalerica]MBB6480576.1 DNA-binding NarL/FixJ family response regulator [Spirochaeta isovalerica]